MKNYSVWIKRVAVLDCLDFEEEEKHIMAKISFKKVHILTYVEMARSESKSADLRTFLKCNEAILKIQKSNGKVRPRLNLV